MENYVADHEQDQAAGRSSTAAHTPGPWSIYARPNETFVMGANDHAVCDLGTFDNNPADNALIVAAPDMLAALQGVRELAEENLIDLAAELQEGGKMTAQWHAAYSRWNNVIAAIAKAEGKS